MEGDVDFLNLFFSIVLRNKTEAGPFHISVSFGIFRPYFLTPLSSCDRFRIRLPRKPNLNIHTDWRTG